MKYNEIKRFRLKRIIKVNKYKSLLIKSKSKHKNRTNLKRNSINLAAIDNKVYFFCFPSVNYNSFNTIIKIMILCLISIFYLILNKNNFSFFAIRKKNFNGRIIKDILEVKINNEFDKMKQRYYTDSFLKPYLDNINILSHIYHKEIKTLKESKNNIHICMCFNDKYIYQILVSITMTLINCDKNNTFITYHFLCNPDVKNSTLSILKSIIYKYPSNLEIIFYDMGSNFIDRNDARLSQSAYYRLLTPVLLDVDKIIYLDGDTIILNDLNEMYQLQFNDNYVLGILDILSNGIDFLGIKSEKYINSGVILLDLKKLEMIIKSTS